MRTIGHLAIGPFRERPWSMAAIGTLGLASMWPVSWAVNQAARWLVLDYPVYYYVSAAWFWQVVAVLPLFLIGIAISRLSRTRPMAAALSIVFALAVVMCVVDPIAVTLLDPVGPARTAGFYAWRAIAGLAMWGPNVMLATMLGRKMRPRVRTA